MPLPSYRDLVLAHGAVGYWRLGEASGLVAADLAPTPHNGTISGGVTLAQPGALADGNTAALFDGTTGQIAVATFNPLVGLTQCSLEGWVYHNGVAWSASYEVLFSIGSLHNLTVHGGKLENYLSIAGAGQHTVGVGTVPTTGWHHVVSTWTSGDLIRTYLDGVLDSSAGPYSGALTTSAGITIGQQGGALFYKGFLDEVAIYPTALTAAQILAHYVRRLNTGTEPPLMYALGGVMRAGVSRANCHSTKTFVAIGGIQRATGRLLDAQAVDNETLAITENEGETPNTCTFSVSGFAPTNGQDVIVTLGSINNDDRLFAGIVNSDAHTYTGSPANGKDTVSAIDYTWHLTRGTISRRWTNTSGTVIARAIIADANRGFTSACVAEGLPVLDEFTVTNQTHAAALTALCDRLGATWKATYHKDVQLGLVADPSQTDPTTLTEASAQLIRWEDLGVTRDISQVITRQPVEGGGGTTLTACAVGETMMPVDELSWYNAVGGTVVSGPQRIAYAGKTQAAPTTPPTATVAGGSGVDTGVHQVAYTFVTAAGETLPSLLATVTVGPTAAPLTAPARGLLGGVGPDPGVHRWAFTFVNAGGETTPSPVSADLTTYKTAVPDPVTAPTVFNGWFSFGAGGHLGLGTYQWAVVWADAASGQTRPGPTFSSSNPFVGGIGGCSLFLPTPPANTIGRLYRTVAGGASLFFVNTFGGGIYSDGVPDASLGAAAPGANTCFDIMCLVPVNWIAVGDAATTARKLYRTAAGGAQLKLVATIADNLTTSFNDTVPDASLGANAPTVNTAFANRVALSAIALGPQGTTQRKVYRTAAGGAQLQLQQTIANNTATVGVLDSTPDSSLGANAPTTDTSGLVVNAVSTTSGATVAGATTMNLVSGAAFLSGGGWANVAGVPFRYAGKAANQLTGIPATGPGAVSAAIPAGSTVTTLPALVGIPASGAGSILYAIGQGDPVNLRVVVDDLPAQAAIALLMLPTVDDGIIEGPLIQDGRIGEAEARARGAAKLALQSALDVAIEYTTRDLNAHAGRTQAANVPAPTNVVGSFKVRSVTIDTFVPALWPTRHARAGSRRVTLEFLLRQARGGA